MIGKLIRKFFFLDSPAHGEFFGMTLLFMLPWFLLVWLCRDSRTIVSLYLRLSGEGQSESAADLVPFGIALLFALYSCCLLLRLLPEIWQNVKMREWLPLLHGVCGMIALCGAVLALADLVFHFVKFISIFVIMPISLWRIPLAKWLERIGGNGFWLTGLALLVFAYLLLGKTIAATYGMQFVCLFGKGVIALWCLFATSYICCAELALYATQNYHISIDELAEYYGQPMNAKGYAGVYYNGHEPDADFWERLMELNDKKNDYSDGCFHTMVDGRQFRIRSGLILEKPDVVVEDNIYKEWKELYRSNEYIRQIETMLDAPLPLPKREYTDDMELYTMSFKELSCIRSLMRMEQWRLRFAMEDNDTAAVKDSWRRMENICEYAGNEPLLISALVWIAVESLRLSSLERLVPWEKTDVAWLEEQSAKLAEQEKKVVDVQQRAVYGEAVFAINAQRLICSGKASQDADSNASKIEPRVMRWFFPQIWRMLAQDAAVGMNIYKVSDFSEFPEKSNDNLLINMISGALRTAGTHKFPSLFAGTRIMRSLIDVELHKRRTGCYPEQFDTLEDPFSRQPLKGKAGQCEQWISVLKFREHNDNNLDEYDDNNVPPIIDYDFEKESRTVDAVQIWSVGPDGIDDGGLSVMTDDKRKDDLRFIIRITSSSVSK